MNIDHLTMKEKLILVGGIRLFLWEIYSIEESLPNESKISKLIAKEFSHPNEMPEKEIDIVLHTAIDLYEKLSFKVLEENEND
ncbi:hypothetical protein P9D57_18105 [Bacillus sonorensis]|uniref:hypothetical protein n=1 Tax=Bacillus sonorensis TaxID=119858 RepID=UPI002DB6830E|nr:hypothetical protein [Bacillus sonorensis]MEC1440607.1 hypothetical protein [Bacillus sonorensis]